MSKLDDLKSLFSSRGLWAKKGLGQNFLVDEKALDTIIEAADLIGSDNVIEVGPGTGFLTEKLIPKVAHVTSVELDPNMVDILRNKFFKYKNFELVHSDILRFAIPSPSVIPEPALSEVVGKAGIYNDGTYKVVANIPYYITSPLLKHFLQSNNRPSLMVALVQKEVAEKICGEDGKSLITIQTQLFGKPEIVATVPSSSFYPSPKVDSAILKIKVYDQPLVPADQLDEFFRIVKFGFSQKRKKLSNGLSAGLRKEPSEIRAVLQKAGLSPDVRPEELGIEEWKRVVEAMPH